MRNDATAPIAATSGRRFWRRAWYPTLVACELTGLGLAIAAAWAIASSYATVEVRAMTAGASVVAWSLLRPWPYYGGLRGTLRSLCVALPTLAILIPLLQGRGYGLSLSYLAAFATIWTVWLIACRCILREVRPRTKVLLINDSMLWNHLVTHENLEITRANTPPAHMRDWDAIALDSRHPLSDDWFAWITSAELAGIEIVGAPALFQATTGRVPLDAVDDRWAAEVVQAAPTYPAVKRALDVAIVLVLSPAIIIVAALVALAIFCESGRPILFWQQRIGRGGKAFPMVKFRTMIRDADASGAAFARQGDTRVTRLGALLRKFRLDEFPQFWNVLAGHMSVIGPRPEQLSFVQKFDEDIRLYRLRHMVRPGITGWAQVRQGYASDQDQTSEKLRYDLFYVKQVSLALDLKIVLLTLRTVVTGFGAR